jgi:hypothetical protein
MKGGDCLRMSVNDELDELDMRILDAIVEITKE